MVTRAGVDSSPCIQQWVMFARSLVAATATTSFSSERPLKRDPETDHGEVCRSTMKQVAHPMSRIGLDRITGIWLNGI